MSIPHTHTHTHAVANKRRAQLRIPIFISSSVEWSNKTKRVQCQQAPFCGARRAGQDSPKQNGQALPLWQSGYAPRRRHSSAREWSQRQDADWGLCSMRRGRMASIGHTIVGDGSGLCSPPPPPPSPPPPRSVVTSGQHGNTIKTCKHTIFGVLLHTHCTASQTLQWHR